jgi:hypothetical protein
MQTRRLTAALALACVVAVPLSLSAQYTVPNIITTTGDVVTVLGSNLFINHGLVGVGRLRASLPDSFNESFGSVSGLQITEWTKTGDNNYTGTFNILPDRGYNATIAAGTFYSDYEARIQRVSFFFTPYTDSANIGGTDIASMIAAQNQIQFPSAPIGTKFTYADVIRGTLSPTTGLEPGTGTTTLFGATVPYVINFTGLASPTSTSTTTYTNIRKLPIDAEALALKQDGSGYFGDEYGANVYYFNASKQIVGVIGIPEALRPRRVAGGPYFFGANPPNPIEGRRINQGFEGVALSPDGSRLFVLLQSAAVQDTNSGAQTRLHTRLLVYDVQSNVVPAAPIREYVVTLPTYRSLGDGAAVDSTAAQSEIVALDNERLLILSRDGNGLGNATFNETPPPPGGTGGLPSVFKSVLLADLSIGNPTNIAGTARDLEGGKVATTPGVLDAPLKAVTTREVINLLNSAQLGKFNLTIDAGGFTQVSPLTLSEKWEGMALVPAQDPLHPHDYFLFVANDNDFLTSIGVMQGPGGTLVGPYDAFAAYNAHRQPANGGPGAENGNDTVFLVFRVTSVFDQRAPMLTGMPEDCVLWPPNHKMVKVATIVASDDDAGLKPGTFTVTATSDDAAAAPGDILVNPAGTGKFDVLLRAERSGASTGRKYTITASASDRVGNIATATASCEVPHDQGHTR